MKRSANKCSQNHNQKRSEQLKSFLEEKDPLLSMKEDLIDDDLDISAHLDIARTVCFGTNASNQEFKKLSGSKDCDEESCLSCCNS